MRRAGLAAAAVAVALAAGALAAVGGPDVAGARDSAYGARIRLARSVFDPADGSPSVPERFAVPSGRAGLWLVQLRVPVSRAAQAALPATGLRLLGVVPDATYVARGSVDQATSARNQKGIRAVVPLQPWFKVAPALDRLRSRQLVQVGTYPDVDAALVADRLRAGGVQVVRVDSDRILTVRADKAHLATIAADDGVAALSPVARMQAANAIASWTTQSARRDYTPVSDHGLDGTGEAAAVADTGSNYFPDKNGRANWYFSDCADPAHPTTGTCKPADYAYQAPDVSPGPPPIGGDPTCDGSGDLEAGTYAHVPTGNRKMLAYFNEVAACAAVPGDSGATTHGSHTSGSVAGNRPPYSSADPNDGQAPQAKLVFQDIGDDTESLAGLPGDLYRLFDQAYNPGLVPTFDRGSSQAADTPAGVPYSQGVTPRVHSNSWGSAVPVVSLGNSPRADDFVTNNEDMAIVVAAGNSGPDQASVGEPGTAKDVITSGAMANGDDDYASLDTMANFSSHGEALNAGVLSPVPARIKPDVATPGLRVVSPKGGTDTETQVLQGTSMSTPVLAGDAVLVRQYFEDGFGPGGPQGDVKGFAAGAKNASAGFNPSAALVKAVLVNSAQRMRGQYTGTQGSDRSQDGQWPSDGQGWGRVQLDRALHLQDVAGSPDLWVRDREFCPPPAHCDLGGGNGLATGDDDPYPINVAEGQPLRVILAWSDPGGIVSAIGLGPENIVNQLSLEVDGPGGKSWCANNINTMADPGADEATSVEDGGCTPLTYDKVNNVQGVYLPHPEAGAYTIHVTGQAVMQDQNAVGVVVPPLVGQQGYALAATGALADAPASTAPPPATATPKVTSSAVSAPTSDLAVVRWTTDVPSTGEVTLTDDNDESRTQEDVYSRKADSFEGLELTQVENDGQFLDKPMLATDHVAKLTGLDPGTHYTVSIRATDATGALSTTASVPGFSTPSAVFAPTVASDTATLYSADTDLGPPIPDATEDTWGISSQFYVGHLPSTASVACRVAGLPVCPPVEAASAFKVRLPEDFAASDITGAALELFTRHDLTSRVLSAPRHTVELLGGGAEKQWGPGTTYQQVLNDPVDATVGPSTVYRQVPYDVEAFTFACADLATLVHNLEDGQAAFRVGLSGNFGEATTGEALDEALYAWETGFGRRSSGLEFRPRLILYGPNGDPLGQTAAAAPAISDVRTERVSDDSAVVHWRTDQPSDSIVFVHEDGTQGGIVQVGSPAFVTEHHVQVDGFDRTTGWQFGLRSTTPDGRATTAANSGLGWLLTADDPAPPGPALAAPGSAGFSLTGVTSETLASQDAVDAGSGRACDPQTLGEPGTAPAAAAPAAQPAASVQPRRLPETGLDGRAPLVALALLGLAALLRARRHPGPCRAPEAGVDA
jgi:subtilase family protein